MNIKNKILEIGKESSIVLKAVAIIMVMVGHYYRFYDIESKLSKLSFIGFFGASIFAFLSGYGVTRSYNAKGFGDGWIIKRITKIYLPFLIVNILSVVFVYGVRENYNNILIRIILGTDDYVMWYIPYILCFNLFFFIIYSLMKTKFNRVFMFGLLCIFQIIVCEVIGIGSQWYTATGALFLGILVAEYKISFDNDAKRVLLFLVIVCVFAMSGIGSKMFVANILIKDWLTCISGMTFCLCLMLAFHMIEVWGLTKYLNFLHFIGDTSLWGYMLHMKVLYLLNKYMTLNFVLYVVCTCVIVAIFYIMWGKIGKEKYAKCICSRNNHVQK